MGRNLWRTNRLLCLRAGPGETRTRDGAINRKLQLATRAPATPKGHSRSKVTAADKGEVHRPGRGRARTMASCLS